MNNNELTNWKVEEEEEEENNHRKELENKEETNIPHLKCDECEQRRNLWLCLRESCMFVGCGCGKDEKSNKHSTLHAQVKLKIFNNIKSINLHNNILLC